MPTPASRTPVRVARGTYANLFASLSDLVEGEVCFATDENTLYLVSGGNLVASGKRVKGDLRFGDSDNSNWVALQAPAVVGSDVTWTLPSADGTNGQVLGTDGSGTLSWITTSAGASVTTSDSAPSSPSDGDLWYDSVSGRLFVYYQDANSSQWVDASPQAASNTTPTKIEVANTKAEIIDSGSDGRFVVTADGAEALRVTAARMQLTGAYDSNITAVAALDIDCSLGNFFTKTINGNSTFTVSNVPASRAYAFTLELTHTSGTITWFSGVEWPGSTAPTLTTGKTHLFLFVTDDGGTRWRASSLINYTN